MRVSRRVPEPKRRGIDLGNGFQGKETFKYDPEVKRVLASEGDLTFKSVTTDPADKKFKEVQRRRAVRAEAVQQSRRMPQRHAVQPVLELAQAVLKLNEDSFDTENKQIITGPSIGDATHGVVAKPKGGALVVRQGAIDLSPPQFDAIHQLWKNYVRGGVVASDLDLARLLSVEGSARQAMTRYSNRVRGDLLDSVAQEQKLRIEELDDEMVNPDELTQTLGALVPRIEQLNSVYEKNLAVQSVESDKFMQLYQAHQHAQQRQGQEIDQIAHQLAHSQQKSKEQEESLREVKKEKLKLLEQSNAMKEAHQKEVRRLQSENQELADQHGTELKSVKRTHESEKADLAMTRERELSSLRLDRDGVQARLDSEKAIRHQQELDADRLRSEHERQRESDRVSNQRLIADAEARLEQRHREAQEQLTASHRDKERNLQQQLDASKSDFAAERARIERQHQSELDGEKNRIRELTAEQERTQKKQVGETDLERSAHVSQLAQIQRDLDRANASKRELEERLTETTKRTNEEVTAAKKEYEQSQQTALEKQKRELTSEFRDKELNAKTLK